MCKAHGPLYHPTLGSRVINRKKNRICPPPAASTPRQTADSQRLQGHLTFDDHVQGSGVELSRCLVTCAGPVLLLFLITLETGPKRPLELVLSDAKVHESRYEPTFNSEPIDTDDIDKGQINSCFPRMKWRQIQYKNTGEQSRRYAVGSSQTVPPPSQYVYTPYRCRANMQHVRQSRPDTLNTFCELSPLSCNPNL